MYHSRGEKILQLGLLAAAQKRKTSTASKTGNDESQRSNKKVKPSNPNCNADSSNAANKPTSGTYLFVKINCINFKSSMKAKIVKTQR